MKKFSSTLILVLFVVLETFSQQNEPYTASFIGRMGTDTVLVETYTMMNNHLYGKAFTRVPEDYIGEFSIHFLPGWKYKGIQCKCHGPVQQLASI